ncbi:1-acyl-sn-glycerol-3-phosphate acyltransferase [Desulfovibrio aminophilus]|nr:lysophospholipid acyltransferase family protein [Desulfovibrio aminophilus]MCM0753660.1 1-acyl-sn-glycerol-3-phosphate acyltransferase [Desulfovibrio aminophilus]
MLRFFLFLLACVPLTLWHSTHMILACLLPGPKGPKGEAIGRRWSRALLRASGLRLDIDLSVLDPAGHYVFMVNHQSNFDIPLLYAVLDAYPIRFVAKKSLFDIPVFGRAMRLAGHIPIDRGNRRSGMKSVQDAVDAAQAGICPVIFPEGTRNPEPGSLLDFKIGGMVLALKCDLPVAPLVLDGTGAALPRGRMILRKGTIRLKALPPVDVSTYTLKERERFRDELRTRMGEALAALPKD